MDSYELDHRGKQLRADLDEEYRLLLETHSLKTAIFGGNDVTDTVLRTIPIGTSFDDAETILRAAGFIVGPRPGPNPQGVRPDRFDVVGSVIPYEQQAFGRVNLYVHLIPSSDRNYLNIHSVQAGFIQLNP